MPTSNYLIDQVQTDTTRFSVDYAAQMADLDKRLELDQQTPGPGPAGVRDGHHHPERNTWNA